MLKGDRIIWVIIAITLLMSLSATFLYRKLNADSIVAIVTRNGETIKRIDLEKETSPREWTINLPDGACNTVRIEPGRIRFIRSNCPKQICVSSGWLYRPGDMAVCLPHRLMISIEGKDRKDGIDALSR